MPRQLTLMMKVGIMYKFVTFKDWQDNYSVDYPYARSNPEKTEVVISCPDGNLTKSETEKRIADTWTPEVFEGP